MRLLARREYCEAVMRARLQARGYDVDCIDRVLCRLRDDDYLSEQRFADGFFRTRMARGEAPWLIAIRAARYGVRDAAIEQAREQAQDSFDALASCRNVLVRRDPLGLRFSDRRLWRRHARYLRNKGYDTDTILRCLNEHQVEV